MHHYSAVAGNSGRMSLVVRVQLLVQALGVGAEAALSCR